MRPLRFMRVRSMALRLAGAAVVLAALAVAAPAAQARSDANPVLNVNFFVNGSIAVTLGDGSAVGATSGTPTVIPAGYYTLQLFGPGGCANVPYFELKGPGTSIVDNMDGGELATNQYNVYLAPNSTFTWRDDNATTVLFTFATSGQVLGTPPPVAGPKGNSAANHGSAQSTNPLGSALPPVRGTLTGAVSAAGKLTVAFNGKSVTSLKAGRYKIVVTDRSASSGFMLQKSSKTVSLTGSRFVGTHSSTVSLTAGRWVFAPLPGKQAFSVAVS